MARPNKLAVAKHRVVRLQDMLRRAEDEQRAEEEQQALEAKESLDPINRSKVRLEELGVRVEAANNCQLVKEMARVNTYNPFADIENTAHILALIQLRLRWNGGL